MPKRCYFVISIMLTLLLNWSSWGSIPPHPRVRKMIKEGKTPLPYFLAHPQEALQRGLNAPDIKPIRKLFGTRTTATPTFKAIAILVKFSDHPSQVQPVFFDSLLFNANGRTLRNYYKEVTYGRLDVVTVDLPSSTGWYTAPQTYSYYVNGAYGQGSYPHNAQKLAEDAIALANPYVDFSQYDNNGDGRVDALFIIHTGPGAEFTGSVNDIWSHKWLTHSPVPVDGVMASTYSMEPEYWETPGDMTCGVYAHESGHAIFGLPDLYDRDTTSEGLGIWSLMAAGSWGGNLGELPSHPDAWCMTRMGLVTLTNITSNTTGVHIPAVKDSAKIFRLWTNGAASQQYFLLENRQQSGYDQSLPGGGILIYHVDESVTTQNDREWYPGYTSNGHYLVALEQADGAWDLERNLSLGGARDAFPGTLNVRTFDNSTVPDTKDYDFAQTYVGVRNISDYAPIMTADFSVQGPPPQIGIAPPSFTLSVIGGDTTSRAMALSNTGQGDLLYRIVTSTASAIKTSPDQQKGVASITGSGGPDAFGYQWKDSDEPGGPVFSWVDVRSTGTLISVSGDDATSASCPIGFQFSFYGNSFTTFRVCTNGWVSFTSTSTTPSNVMLPSVSAPGNLLAPFWTDLVFASNKAYYYNDGTRLIIQYDDVRSYGDPSSHCSFEIILYPSGKIVYQYLTLTGSVTQATVGIQNATQDTGTTVVFNGSYLHSNLAIEFVRGLEWLTVFPALGTVPPAGNQNISLFFDTRSVSPGDYDANLLIASNDTLQDSITVPVHLHIEAPVYDLSFAPQSIYYGSVSVGASKLDSVTVTNTGTGSLNLSSIVSTNSQFTVAPTSATIARGTSRKFYVTFAPSSSGSKSGSIILTHNAPGSPDTVSVSGNGIAPGFSVTPTSVLFGTISVETIKMDSVQVNNTGLASLTIFSVASDDSQFVVTPSSATIAPLSSRWFSVTFQPQSVGEYSGNIIFTHNALGTPDSVSVSGNAQWTAEIVVRSKWNIVSVPSISNNMTLHSLFPSAVSRAYAFNSTYIPSDTLGKGRGYWLKFASDQVIPFSGYSISQETVSVQSGWNLIGALTEPIHASRVIPIGTNINSLLYGFDRKYYTTDSLRPGHGYWIRIDSAGKLVLSSTGMSSSTASLANRYQNTVEKMNSLTFDESSGGTQALYFGNESGDILLPAERSIPPVPPEGAFDVRFVSQQLIETFPPGVKESRRTITISSASFPITVRWNVKADDRMQYVLTDASDRKLLNKHLTIGEGSIVLHDKRLATIVLNVTSIPAEFSLEQNYPNPFNPSTDINYQIADVSHVSLKVYDVLGREVATLVDEVKQPGEYSVRWDASNYPSGVYFYRIVTGDFSQTKKLVLMR